MKILLRDLMGAASMNTRLVKKLAVAVVVGSVR